MTYAFVLGNGKSRLEVDLHQLKSFGKIYGCNALYRDFIPDILVATDKGIADDIQFSGYSLDNIFYTRKPLPDLGARQIVDYFGYSSGPIALSLACKENPTKIFLIGFDLQGIEGKFNNVYADTDHYKKSQQSETYYGNWVQQIYKITCDYPKIKITHIAGHTTLKPKEWQDIIKFESINNFLNAINNNKLDQI